MKTTANPKGLVTSNSAFGKATANPVMEGALIKKLIIKITETALAMNKEIFIFIH